MRKFDCIFVGELDLILFPSFRRYSKSTNSTWFDFKPNLLKEKGLKFPQTFIVEAVATSTNIFKCSNIIIIIQSKEKIHNLNSFLMIFWLFWRLFWLIWGHSVQGYRKFGAGGKGGEWVQIVKLFLWNIWAFEYICARSNGFNNEGVGKF